MSGVILSVVTPSARLHEGCNPDSTHSSVNTPWSIVVALRSYISVQGKWLVSNCPLLVGFTGLLEGDIWVGGGGGGGRRTPWLLRQCMFEGGSHTAMLGFHLKEGPWSRNEINNRHVLG